MASRKELKEWQPGTVRRVDAADGLCLEGTLMQYVVTVALDHTGTADESDASRRLLALSWQSASRWPTSPRSNQPDLRRWPVTARRPTSSSSSTAVRAGAYCPDLPGVGVVSATRDGAEQLIPEAVPFHIDGLRDAGESIPEPSAVAGELVRVTAAWRRRAGAVERTHYQTHHRPQYLGCGLGPGRRGELGEQASDQVRGRSEAQGARRLTTALTSGTCRGLSIMAALPSQAQTALAAKNSERA
jgi:predicted RNase H-like HicB family nuclease